MADTDDKKKNEDPKAEKDEQSRQAGTKISILTWIIMAVIVVLFAGSGFVLGRLFTGSSSKPEITESSQKNTQTKEMMPDDSETGSKDTWYYNDLESVVANLNEPAATRYIRASLKLEISSGLNEEKGKALLEEKKPILTNWLTIYLAGLTLEDIRGDKNLKRIQLQILDAFNEKLFPDAKPQIKHILFKEFAIQ